MMQHLDHKAFLLQILIYQFGPLTAVEILPPHLETEINVKNKHFSGLPLIFGENRMQDINATLQSTVFLETLITKWAGQLNHCVYKLLHKDKWKKRMKLI